MTDLALIVLLRRAVLVAELPDVAVLASDAHMQRLDVFPLFLQLSLHDGSGYFELMAQYLHACTTYGMSSLFRS